MSLDQYLGRRYDLAIFQGVQSQGDTRLVQSLFGDNSGAVTTGTNKLSQRVAIELLMDADSPKYQINRGTSLVGSVRRGELRTETDVYIAFSFAAARVEQLFRSQEEDSDPDEERLESLELLSLALSPDQLRLTVQINTAAGTSRTVILPITVMPP
jgi:hypothetical protein